MVTTPQSAIMIVLGVIACFAGYSMFRTMLPLWGFILGGWLAYSFLPVAVPDPRQVTSLYRIAAFVGGGLIGAVVAIPLYFVIIFLTGAALGGFFGILVGAIIDLGGISTMRQITSLINMAFPPVPTSTAQFVMMTLFGVVLGVMAISFQKFMIIASSSFVGAAALISGLTGTITRIATTDVNRAVYIFFGWLVLGLLGMFIQFRAMGET